MEVPKKEEGQFVEGEEKITVFNSAEIQRIIPHRYPILMIDRVKLIGNGDKKATGYKCVSGNEPFFQGHFPGQPVVPGVCTLTVIRESVSHAAGREMMFSSIKECKFLSALIPAEDLKLNLDITLAPDGQLKCNVIHNDAVAMKVSAAMTDIRI